MTTFTWKVFVMTVIPELNGVQDVVTSIQFIVIPDNKELNIRDELITLPMEYIHGQEFVPYSELTEELVLSWIDQRKNGIENMILARVTNAPPRTLEKPLSWEKQ